MERSYLTSKEIEALELFKAHKSQRDVAEKMESSAANVSLTLKRAREKIVKSNATILQAEEEDYLHILGISYLSDAGRILHAMLNSSEKAVCIVNKNHEIVMVNQALEMLVHKRASAFMGNKCYDIFVGKKCSKSDCPANISFRTGEPKSAVRELELNNGRSIEVKITAIPVKNGRGRAAFVIEYMEPT